MIFNEQPNRRTTYGSTTGKGSSSSYTSGDNRPRGQNFRGSSTGNGPTSHDRHNVNALLGDMIPRNGIMGIEEEIIPAIRTEGRTKRLHQGSMTLRWEFQGMQHQRPGPLNL